VICRTTQRDAYQHKNFAPKSGKKHLKLERTPLRSPAHAELLWQSAGGNDEEGTLMHPTRTPPQLKIHTSPLSAPARPASNQTRPGCT
jgi:hypothetical protein